MSGVAAVDEADELSDELEVDCEPDPVAAQVLEAALGAVVAVVVDEVFAFVVEHTTTWRYEFRALDGATSVTESFSHPPRTGWEKFAYDTVARRPTTMVTGMQRTLEGIRRVLEG